MTDTQKILEEFDVREVLPFTLSYAQRKPEEMKGIVADKINWAVNYKINQVRSKLLLELLQVFNDYDVPLTMTAEQVRDILEEYLTKKD